MAKGVRLKDKDGPVYPCPFFPVGAIYMSVNAENPSTYFGGTWVEIQGRFLLGRSSGYAAGSEGGEASHKLSVNEMPAHNHSCGSAGSHKHGIGGRNKYNLSGNGNAALGYGSSVSTLNYSTSTVDDHAHTIGSIGGGAAHNNMPPYLAVYIWKRTA